MSCVVLVAGLLMAAPATWAATLYDSAEALYKLDFAASGAVAAASEITDSSGNGHHATLVTNSSILTWVTVPSAGPGGAPAVDPVARGLNFAPNTTVTNTSFTVGSGLAISGSQSLVSRIQFDGMTQTNQTQAWIFQKSFSTLGRGYLFGIRNVGSIASPKFVLAALTTSTVAPGTALVPLNSSLELSVSQWYDIALVWNDQGTVDASDDAATFYLGSASGIQSQTFTGVAMPIESLNSLRVGHEAASKPFAGQMDFVGLWGQALNAQEISTLFAPEPASLGLLTIGSLVLLRHKR